MTEDRPAPSTPATNCHFGLRPQLIHSTFTAYSQSSSAGLRNGGSIAAFALANVLLFTGGTEAQTPSATPPSQKAPPTEAADAATEMSEVVVRGAQDSYKAESASSTKYTEPLVNVAQTVTVIPKKLIEEQGATSLRDVLRNVTGISMQAGEGGVPSGDNLSIRGFNARTDLFIDGVRDLGGYSRDPFNIEQVEVVKGPASAYSGRGSTGGSINMATKAPGSEAFVAGSLGIGTASNKRETLDINQPLHTAIPAAVRLNALWTEADVPGRNITNSSRWGIAPSIAFGIGTPTNLTLNYLHLEEDNIPDNGIPWVPITNVPLINYRNQPAPVDYRNYYGLTSRDYEKIQSDLITAEFKHALNDNIGLRYLSRYGRTYRDSIITSPRFNSTATTDILRELKSRDQIDTIFTNQAEATFKIDTWSAGHTLLTGLELDLENEKNYDRTGPATPLGNLFSPDSTTPYPGSISRTGALNQFDATSLAIYAFDTVKLNEKWQLSGGLRLDRNELTFDSKPVTGATTSLSRLDKKLSWRSGVVYKPRPNGSIYAAYGTSFNSSVDGLTLNAPTTAAALAGQATLFGLAPETSTTMEIGTKWDFLAERLGFTAAVFRTNKSNVRTPGLPGDPPTVLGGKQRVEGFELGLTGQITKGWQVYGGYTYLHSKILTSNTRTEIGNNLPNTPEQSFSLWSTYELPWKIQLGAGARFVDSRFSAADNLRNAPGYYILDSSLSYKITKNVDVRLNVYNLANKKYLDSVGGGHVVPGAGRSGTLTLSFKF